ncbi:MAG: hypothetical protein SFX73_27135 [Kofleriaceae bacterium]|nr:hypothetical protein [Kofleriaceae bacterium]
MFKTCVLVSSVCILITGCGKKKEGGGDESGAAVGGKLVASCDQRDLAGAPIKNCIEYTGSVWTKKEVQSRCGLEGHKFLEGPCPAEGVVFTCLQEAGKPVEARLRFYDKPERAQKVCKDVNGVPQ